MRFSTSTSMTSHQMDRANDASKVSTLSLPLTNLLSTITPTLLAPLLPRLAFIESFLLLSSPSSLLRRLGLDTKKIIALWAATLFALGHKRNWRDWRMAVEVLGVLEGLARTVGLLEDFQLFGRAEAEAAIASDEREDDEGEAEELRLARVQLYAAARHVLSFWLFYATLTTVERISWTGTPSSQPSTTHQLRVRARHFQFQLYQICVPPYLRARQLLSTFREQLSTLPPPPISLPSITLPSLPDYLRLSPFSLLPIRPFPQPPNVTGTSDRVRSTPPPPPTTPAFVPLVKLVLLLYSLRKDGSGASMIWDWIVGPYMAVRRRRKALGPSSKRNKSWVVRLQDDDDAGDEEGEGLERTSTSAPSSPTATLSRTSQNPDFPTPSHVPYRLTSSSHPIHANRLLSSEYDDASPTPSPSSIRRTTRGHYGGSEGPLDSDGEEGGSRNGGVGTKAGEWDDTWTS